MSDHKKAAELLLAVIKSTGGSGWADSIAEAQAHATLALVEQQRIANLIAYAAKVGTTTDLSKMHATDVADFHTIVANIRTGLDLA